MQETGPLARVAAGLHHSSTVQPVPPSARPAACWCLLARHSAMQLCLGSMAAGGTAVLLLQVTCWQGIGAPCSQQPYDAEVHMCLCMGVHCRLDRLSHQ